MQDSLLRCTRARDRTRTHTHVCRLPKHPRAYNPSSILYTSLIPFRLNCRSLRGNVERYCIMLSYRQAVRTAARAALSRQWDLFFNTSHKMRNDSPPEYDSLTMCTRCGFVRKDVRWMSHLLSDTEAHWQWDSIEWHADSAFVALDEGRLLVSHRTSFIYTLRKAPFNWRIISYTFVELNFWDNCVDILLSHDSDRFLIFISY